MTISFDDKAASFNGAIEPGKALSNARKRQSHVFAPIPRYLKSTRRDKNASG